MSRNLDQKWAREGIGTNNDSDLRKEREPEIGHSSGIEGNVNPKCIRIREPINRKAIRILEPNQNLRPD